MKLALGTVQFGLKYGVANHVGMVPESEVSTILKIGSQAEIDTLDTAIGYGVSEAVLGRCDLAQSRSARPWRVVSKLPPLPDSCENVSQWVETKVRGSLSRLNLPQLDALLLHRPSDLLGKHGAEYCYALARVKAEGLTGAVGISIYDPAELKALFAGIPGFPKWQPDLVQAPCSVLDRRLVQSGWLYRLLQRGVRVHLRSAFLQGLLLMDRARRPAYFQPWAPLLDNWMDWCEKSGVSQLQAALSYPLSLPGVERVVVGVDSSAQLQEMIIAAQAAATTPPLPDHLFSSDPALLEPSRWNSTT